MSISCNKNKFDVDVSEINVETKISRFEKELFYIPASQAIENTTALKKKYQRFYDLFTANIIGIGKSDDPNFKIQLQSFLEDKNIREMSEDVIKAYPDLDLLEKDLNKAFSYYKYYFPDKQVPAIISFISGFNYSIITDEGLIGIGLDMYLGSNSKYYDWLRIPKYKVSNMEQKNILPDVMKAWISTEFQSEEEKTTLLSQMISEGKVLYMLDALLPWKDDTLKIGYSLKQIEWCRNNEINMWKHLIEKNLLYSTEHLENIKYIGEAPFTSGFPRESPGRTGAYIGWRIIRSFMEKNNFSIPELFAEKDAQKILTKSKYRP